MEREHINYTEKHPGILMLWGDSAIDWATIPTNENPNENVKKTLLFCFSWA